MQKKRLEYWLAKAKKRNKYYQPYSDLEKKCYKKLLSMEKAGKIQLAPDLQSDLTIPDFNFYNIE